MPEPAPPAPAPPAPAPPASAPPVAPGGRHWLPATPARRTALLAFVCVGALLAVFFVAMPACRDAYNDARSLEETRFKDYSEHINGLMASLDPEVPSDSPAYPSLRKAHDAYRLAQAERGLDLEAAKRSLQQANEYICEVTAQLGGLSCSPPRPHPLEALNDPWIIVVVTGGMAVAGSIGSIWSGAAAVLAWKRGGAA